MSESSAPPSTRSPIGSIWAEATASSGLPAVTFWLNPSLYRMLAPAAVKGDWGRSSRLLIAYESSLGWKGLHRHGDTARQNFHDSSWRGGRAGKEPPGGDRFRAAHFDPARGGHGRVTWGATGAQTGTGMGSSGVVPFSRESSSASSATPWGLAAGPTRR